MIFSLIRLFGKLQAYRADFEKDTLFLLDFLTGIRLPGWYSASGLVGDNLKLQTAALIASLSRRDNKNSVTKRSDVLKDKLVDTFCQLINDPSVVVFNYTLECLTEFLQSSDANNLILSDICRSDKLGTDPQMRLTITYKLNNYINQIALKSEISEKV